MPPDDPTLTKDVEIKYSEIFQKGRICDVTCSGGGFKIQNKASDFGKKASEIPDGVYLGNKLWMPKKVVNNLISIQARARQVVDKYTLSFPIARMRFVKASLVPDVQKGVDDQQKALELWKKDMESNYETYKLEVLETMSEYRDSILRAFKPIDMILRECRIQLSFFEISLPRQITPTDFATLSERADSVNFARKQAEDALQNQVKVQADALDSFFATAREELSAVFLEEFESTLDRIKNNKPVTATGMSKLLKVIQEFKSMDILDNKELVSKLSEVEGVLSGGASERDLRTTIQAAVSLVNEQIANDKAQRDPKTGRLYRKIIC